MTKLLVRCTNCLMPITRPRIRFNDDGVCNACTWSKEKKDIDYEKRGKQLEELCEKFRSKDGNFDCIIPVSGGKDSSYVAYMMKHVHNMHPLCVNINPPLAMQIGNENLKNFMESGYDTMIINPNPEITRQIGRKTMVEYGQPLMAWMTNVQAAIFRLAVQMNIPLVMFGEEGETEYGGSKKLKDTPYYGLEESLNIYLSGIDPKQYKTSFSDKELYFWNYPSEEEFRKANLAICHYSYFENWDPYEHYLVAKKHCGLKEKKSASSGTYTNFAQTDTSLYDLHTYFMFLKFGFGRCTADVGIDIRRGAMQREQAIELVKRFDGHYPEPYMEEYCEYFRMSADDMNEVFDKWANKEYLKQVGPGKWVLAEGTK